MRYTSSQSGFTPRLKLTLSQFFIKVFSVCKNFSVVAKAFTRRLNRTKRREFGCQGFSLVETLVSITILLIVITGPLAISSSAAKSSSFSSEQVTAFFLAQEGAELAEKARDDLLIPYFVGANSDPWADFTRISSGGGFRNCYVTINTNGCDFTVSTDAVGTLTITNCATLSNCLLYLDKTTPNLRSRFSHTVSVTPTPYTRTIKLEPVTDSSGNIYEVKVTSTVTWRTGALKQQQEVVVETRLFNVYGY